MLHALVAGHGAEAVRDAIAAVDVRAGDGERALAQMRRAGARVVGGWGREDSNLRLTDYESAALTN